MAVDIVGEGDGWGVGVGEICDAGDAALVSGLDSWDVCGTICGVICVDEDCCSLGVAARNDPGKTSTKQQMPIANLLTSVILSGTERRRSEVKSKDPEVVSFATQLQGILTKIPIRSPALPL